MTQHNNNDEKRGNGKKVILYVEDDPDYREAVRAMIEDGGYTVIEAETAEEGLRKYRETHPDLLLVDLMMEEVDAGTNLVKELRAIGQEVPILLLSSVGDSLAANKDYHELGLSGVLQKPVSRETLLSVISSRLK